MREQKLAEISRRLNEEKKKLITDLPSHLQDDFAREGFISGGCIYSLYNDKEPKDYDFFVESESLANRLREFFMSLVIPEVVADDEKPKVKNIYIVHYRGHRIVVTKNAISIGKYQIITKFFGAPKQVVGQFDFMHNTYWHKNNRIDALSDWDFLEDTKLVYNEQRARDITGTIIRVPRFIARGMTITNVEMSKMLKKLRDVGFTERENEIIDNGSSY
ncbi:hypothetical protein BSK59_15840 [Paenibacillus odorifer]|uniref:hypothetical protein n=1 Tax=Paenibacillus odorifer TaxID=189426 RepID=UPI00096F3FE5|nr:hypothetical protein [Paenibacillus odorifer]OME54052.1 hypothetical protein BSK59_15840 [Paenibacillus odorifer]